jgi:uncharacterized damage-inducible protein DinB
MSKLELIRAFYEYNEYANNRVLEAASALSKEEFSRKQGASFDSVEGNLAHIRSAQVVWLGRWRTGRSPDSLAELQSTRGLDTIRAGFEASHAELREFLSILTEDRLHGVLIYTDSGGNAHERVLWQLMLHVANHSSYHRAETAMALTAMGHNPGDLDYSYFEYARDANVR